MDKNALFKVSPGPHVRGGLTTLGVMYEVILALIPAAVFGMGRYGTHALLVLVTSVVTAMLAEYAFDCFAGRENTVRDGSAALTGLLLGLTLPADVELYIPFAGAIFAVTVFKGFFGGLGRNLLDPALGARCLLTVAFREQMAGKEFAVGTAASDYLRALIAHPAGLIGCSALALLVGGLFLLAVKGITWHIPVSVLAGFAVFSLLFGGSAPILYQFGGGIVLAAFFMAVDPVTGPVSDTGKLIYGGLIGLLAALFQKLTGPMEAVCIAVLLANLTTPLIDKRFVPRPYTF